MFLGGVKPDTPDDAIKSYFQQFGEVRKVDAKNWKLLKNNKKILFNFFHSRLKLLIDQ